MHPAIDVNQAVTASSQAELRKARRSELQAGLSLPVKPVYTVRLAMEALEVFSEIAVGGVIDAVPIEEVPRA